MPLKLDEGSRKVVYTLYNYFKICKNDKDSLEFKTDANVSQIVSRIAKISCRHLNRIIREEQAIKDTTVCKEKKKRKSLNIRNYDLGAVRRNIYRIYTVKQQIPSLWTIITALKENGIFEHDPKLIRRLLNKIGFSSKFYNKKSFWLITERFDLIESRFDYLRAMHKYRSQKRTIIFVGETAFDPIQYADDLVKGPRLTVMLAGSRTGLIDGVAKIFTSNENSSVTSDIFHNWVDQKLKDKLPSNSVVVMGSENYHCVQVEKPPTIVSLKSELQDWLRQRNIPFAEDMCKIELLKIINSIQSQKTYKVNEILQGHTVLHIPPFHTDLNPMELVFNDLKEYLAKELVVTAEGKTSALHRLFSEYNAEQFQKHDDYSCYIEKEYWSYDMKMDDAFDKVILDMRNRERRAASGSGDSENEGSDSAISDDDNFDIE